MGSEFPRIYLPGNRVNKGQRAEAVGSPDPLAIELALPYAPAAAGLGLLGTPLLIDYLVAVVEVPLQRRLRQAQLLLALVADQHPLPFLFWGPSGRRGCRTLLGRIARDVVHGTARRLVTFDGAPAQVKGAQVVDASTVFEGHVRVDGAPLVERQGAKVVDAAAVLGTVVVNGYAVEDERALVVDARAIEFAGSTLDVEVLKGEGIPGEDGENRTAALKADMVRLGLRPPVLVKSRSMVVALPR